MCVDNGRLTAQGGHTAQRAAAWRPSAAAVVPSDVQAHHLRGAEHHDRAQRAYSEW